MGYFGNYNGNYSGNYFGDGTGVGGVVNTVPAVRTRKRWDLHLEKDYLVWDDRESIKLTSTRRPGSAHDFIPDALRRELTRREMAASNGTYRAGDVVWEVPMILVHVGRLKPGDLVTDKDEEEYTVLDAKESVDRTIQTLVTRNLVIAEGLNDRINIERSSVIESPTGARIKRWPSDKTNPDGVVTYRNLACRVQPQETGIVEERGIQGNNTRFNIYLSREIEVDLDEMRVLFKGRYFEMIAYRQSEQIGELPLLEAAEVP